MGDHRNQNETTSQSRPRIYTVRSATLDDLPKLPDVENSAGQLFRTMSGLADIANDEPMDVETHELFWHSSVAWRVGGTWVAVHSPAQNEYSNEAAKDLDASRGGDSPVVVAMNNLTFEEGKASGESGREEIVGFICTSVMPREQAQVSSDTVSVNVTEPVIHSIESTQNASIHAENVHHAPTDPETDSIGPDEYFVFVNEMSIHASHQRRGLASTFLRTVEEDIRRHGRRQHDPNSVNMTVKVVGMALTTFRDVPFNAPFYRKHGFEEVPVSDIRRVVGDAGAELWQREQQQSFEKGGDSRRDRRCFMVKWLRGD